jgi:hypothetical protein
MFENLNAENMPKSFCQSNNAEASDANLHPSLPSEARPPDIPGIVFLNPYALLAHRSSRKGLHLRNKQQQSQGFSYARLSPLVSSGRKHVRLFYLTVT